MITSIYNAVIQTTSSFNWCFRRNIAFVNIKYANMSQCLFSLVSILKIFWVYLWRVSVSGNWSVKVQDIASNWSKAVILSHPRQITIPQVHPTAIVDGVNIKPDPNFIGLPSTLILYVQFYMTSIAISFPSVGINIIFIIVMHVRVLFN